jgi:pilus assembly protein CpaD
MPFRFPVLLAAASLALGGCTGIIPAPPETHLVQAADGKTEAIVTGCPNWEPPQGAWWTNAPSANFGCATAQNLAAMLVDPAELEGGKTPNAAPAARLGLRETQWRSGGGAAIDAGAGASDTRE